MSEEMKLKKDYQETFNEVHAPAALSGKVMNMARSENKKTTVSFVKKCAAAAAIALVVFVGGNGIVYAATGNTLLKTVMVYFNGTGYEVDLEGQENEDGSVTYSATFDVEDAEAGNSVVITDEMEFEEGPYGTPVDLLEIVEKDGKMYLVDGDVELDVTEDLADGEAAGSYEKDGETYQYEVSGEKDNWNISVWNGEDAE